MHLRNHKGLTNEKRRFGKGVLVRKSVNVDPIDEIYTLL